MNYGLCDIDKIEHYLTVIKFALVGIALLFVFMSIMIASLKAELTRAYRDNDRLLDLAVDKIRS